MTRMTYPDGEVLSYVYDNGGLSKKPTAPRGRINIRTSRNLTL